MKKIIMIMSILTFVFSNAMAVKQNNATKPNKAGKQKHLPKGLQKKVARGEELPPGWQKKIAKGEVVDNDFLKNARILHPREYPYPEYKTEGSEIYKIQNKIFKVLNATNTIIDVIKK